MKVIILLTLSLMKKPPVFCNEDEVKILKGSIAWYSVVVSKIYDEGDHKIIICEIKNLDIKSKKILYCITEVTVK